MAGHQPPGSTFQDAEGPPPFRPSKCSTGQPRPQSTCPATPRASQPSAIPARPGTRPEPSPQATSSRRPAVAASTSSAHGRESPSPKSFSSKASAGNRRGPRSAPIPVESGPGRGHIVIRDSPFNSSSLEDVGRMRLHMPNPPRGAPTKSELQVPRSASGVSSRSGSDLADSPSTASSYSVPESPSQGWGLAAKVPSNSVGIGIETEFLVTYKPGHRKLLDDVIELFSADMAQIYNRSAGPGWPLMESRVGYAVSRTGRQDKHDQWLLLTDSSPNSTKKPPWGMEMTSPLLYSYRGSPWRTTVQNCWAALEEDHRISVTEQCATLVHISMKEGFRVEDLRRIAQCIIHFEPAIEAIVPADRRGNRHAKSNWLENKYLAGAGKTRSQAIRLIGETSKREEVRRLMGPGSHDDSFAWSFSKLSSKKTIGFRKGAASSNAGDALRWAELAMTFVVAATETPDVPAYLKRTPPNLAGLKTFLLQGRKQPQQHQPSLLQPFWTTMPPPSSSFPPASSSSHHHNASQITADEYVEPRFAHGDVSGQFDKEVATKMSRQELNRYHRLRSQEHTPSWL